MTEFWWSSNNKRRKFPLVAWQKLCKKKEEGGMGFHDISRFNQALLCKQAWWILHHPHSLLSRVLKHCYFKNTCSLNCGVGTRPSYAWRSIIHGRVLLKRGLLKGIGDGRGTSVSCENWILDENPQPQISLNGFMDTTLKVSNLVNPLTGGWDKARIHQTFVEQDAAYILKIKISTRLQDTSRISLKPALTHHKSGYMLLETFLWSADNPSQLIIPYGENHLVESLES